MTNVRTIPPELPSRLKAKAIAFCTNLKRDNVQAHQAASVLSQVFLWHPPEKQDASEWWKGQQRPKNHPISKVMFLSKELKAFSFRHTLLVQSCGLGTGTTSYTSQKDHIAHQEQEQNNISIISYHFIVLNFSDLRLIVG